MTTTLVPIDGSQSSMDALKYAALSRPQGNLILLYVAPSARQVDLERGRFLLEDSRRACQGLARDIKIQTRLEVGDRREKLPEVAAREGCDLIIMGAHGVNALPHLEPQGSPETRATEVQPPVVIVLPTGQGIRASTSNPGPESAQDEE